MSGKYQARLRNVRLTPRKARLLADLVREKPVQIALDSLKLTNKKGSPILFKLISSAVANASQGATIDVDRLVISEVFVDQGFTMKRFLPRAQGRATVIRKRTSHITVRVSEV